MKKLMRTLAAVMALLMALSVVTVSAFAEEAASEENGGRMPIGSTPYSIVVPEGYYDAGVNEEDVLDGMISTFVADGNDLSFDVYEFEKSELYPTLDAFMTADCEAYNGTGLTLDSTISGVKVASYLSNDEYNGKIYIDKNYAFEYGDKIVQIDFYYEDAASEELCDQIMSTFKMDGVRQIALGLSGYSIMIPKDFAESETGEEDWEAGIIRAFSNEYTGLEIETYWFANESGASLEEVAKAQCEAYNGTLLPETEINGIPMAEYVAVQTYDGEEYIVYVVLVQGEDGSISAAAFYLNNYCAYVQAEAYMHTLGEYDNLKNVPLEATVLQLGSSGYQIDLPCGFISNSYPQEEFEEDGLLAAYVSPHSDISIDLYQSLKSDEETADLVEFTEIDAAKYSGTEIELSRSINNIPVTVYRSEETYDDIKYNCLTYTFEAKELYFVQLCFYWTAEDMTEDVEAIMNSLAPTATKEVAIANGAYTLTVAADTQVTGTTEEDAGYTANYLTSETGAPTILAFSTDNPENLSLEDYAAASAKQYEASEFTYSVNGNSVTSGSYVLDYTEQDTGSMFGIIVTYLEADGVVYELDFVVESYAQYMMAMDILSTVKAA